MRKLVSGGDGDDEDAAAAAAAAAAAEAAAAVDDAGERAAHAPAALASPKPSLPIPRRQPPTSTLLSPSPKSSSLSVK
jgi:hypothetical protein